MMRDPQRIDKVCAEIARIWKRYPDFRFTQMISNFYGYKQSDCYYMEDEKFVKELEEFFDEILGKEV